MDEITVEDDNEEFNDSDIKDDDDDDELEDSTIDMDYPLCYNIGLHLMTKRDSRKK